MLSQLRFCARESPGRRRPHHQGLRGGIAVYMDDEDSPVKAENSIDGLLIHGQSRGGQKRANHCLQGQALRSGDRIVTASTIISEEDFWDIRHQTAIKSDSRSR